MLAVESAQSIGPSRPPLILAESGTIIEYLCDHFDQEHRLVPKRYADGKEGEVGGETEEWLRYRYYMHYSEGSMMPLLVMQVVMNGACCFS